MIKIATVATGIGSPEEAIKQLNIPHKVVFGCDIDKFARASYLANFEGVTMHNDMTLESWEDPEQYSDLFIGGIPCQAFSMAGKRLGELDPRGLLFFDFYRYVKNRQPKVFIIENVKGLLSASNGTTFQNWLHLLGRSINCHEQMFLHPDSLKYNLHYTILNTKNFGLPQNRERVFIVGIRKDLPNTFSFPAGFPLTKTLQSVLQSNVDEKYYLSETMIKGFLKHKENSLKKGRGFIFKPIEDTEKKISSTITASVYKMAATDNFICVPARIVGRNPENPKARIVGQYQEQTIEVNKNMNVVNTITTVQKDNVIIEGKLITKAHDYCNRVYNTAGISPCLTTMTGGGQEPKISINQRIRRLTPLECWRLQGFPDENFHKAKAVNSETQLYKQAGNSMSVPVMKAIIQKLLPILLTK